MTSSSVSPAWNLLEMPNFHFSSPLLASARLLQLEFISSPLQPHSSPPLLVSKWGWLSSPLCSASLSQRLASNFQKFHCDEFKMNFSGLFCWGSLSLLNISYIFYQILEKFRYYCFRDGFLATFEFLLLSHGILKPCSFLSFCFPDRVLSIHPLVADCSNFHSVVTVSLF